MGPFFWKVSKFVPVRLDFTSSVRWSEHRLCIHQPTTGLGNQNLHGSLHTGISHKRLHRWISDLLKRWDVSITCASGWNRRTGPSVFYQRLSVHSGSVEPIPDIWRRGRAAPSAGPMCNGFPPAELSTTFISFASAGLVRCAAGRRRFQFVRVAAQTPTDDTV